MWEAINNFLVAVDDKVWGVPLMVLIIAGGVLLTSRLGFLQVRRLPLALKWMFKNEEEGDGEISSFAALCTALSATIGTGNIVGVATAVCAGGPGALFWMIVAAFFGMATKFSEGLLAVKYRVVAEDGHSLGGPFYYIEKGMGPKWKWLGKIFAFFGVCVGLFGIGTFSQVNGISSAVQNFFDPDKTNCINIPFLGQYSVAVVVSSLILAFCVAAILIGGLKRIATVSQIIVPFMAVIYIIFSITLIICNITEIPAAIVTVVKAAFNPSAVTGGVVGSMIVAMQKGVARGIFSNEAGLGSAAIAHSAADTPGPVQQGMYGIFECFADTIVICSLTALTIICSGVEIPFGVKPGSELDNEAFSRATSVYYADQVVPMLPKALSNGICSLNENELRLAFSCLMRLDKEGNLTDYRFVKSIIRSRVKGVYSEINALLAGTADAEIKAKYADVIDQLPAMKELYGHRARLRKERGCMDIESGEVKLILDENGRCIDVKKRTSGESESMIEEFMLLANQCAAHFARVKQIPFVYRVHEEPNAEKLERLHALLQACGINDHFAKDVPTPKELSAILEGVRGTPYEQIINTGMLRCMSKALYEEKPKGHYGLVLKDYAHFTSPIRRYPDLAIHRIMTDMLKGTEKETMILRYTDFAERASKQSSEREVIAMQIERKAEDCYKAEYARRHLGECYEGTISGVTQRGLFIELDNGVEGFVPASSLTPSGTSLTEGVRLTDPASGKTWSLGDKMMITIVRADVNLGKIDFEVAPAAQA